MRNRMAHRTFAGQRGGGGGGGGGTPVLPSLGLMFNVQGDIGLVSAAGVPTNWADTSGLGQNIDTIGGTPATGVFTIDGIPTVSFPAVWGVNGVWVGRTASMVKSDGVTVLDGTMPRTVMVMALPIYAGAPGIRITGGNVFSFLQNSIPYQCMFELGPEPPEVGGGWPVDGAYAWASGWTPLAGGPSVPNNQFGPVPSVPGGTYDLVPTLLEWSNAGPADLEFRINNVPVTLSPVGRGAAGVSVFSGFLIGNSQPTLQSSFFGAIAQVSAWDYKLSTNGADHAAAIELYKARYPSAPIVSD